MNRNVYCIHCGLRVTLPESKPEYKNQTAATFLKLLNWQFYGRGKGQCPDCNLFTGQVKTLDQAERATA